jgi:hypothetical protein
MSDAELAEIEARASAATTGLWRSWIEGRDHFGGDSVITTGGDDIYLYPPGRIMSPFDQDFIAAARQDVPRLVAEIRRLRRIADNRAHE